MNDSALTMPRFDFRFDPIIASVSLLLLVIGLLMMTSASVSIADKQYGNSMHFLQRQTIAALIGLVGVAITLMVPTRFWERTGFFALLLAFVLLIAVLIPGVGHTVNGSTRWFRLGVMNFQASEAVRVLILFYLCGYLVRHQQQVRSNFAGFAKPMVFVVLASCLLLMEPDFGAATVLLGITLGVLFIGGVKLRHYILLVLLAIVSMAAMALSSPYRMKRLTAFLDPWQDQFGSGFQLTQSLIAIGRGEWFGVGFGGSVQKLFYLPEAHTDFVFAVLAEETGLVGASLVIALYFVLVARGFAVARQAIRQSLLFQGYLAFGLSLWLGFQSFINIGVNMGVLPTKGLTLPLMSYGGSSLLISMISIALLLRISHEVEIDATTPSRPKAAKAPVRKKPARRRTSRVGA